MRLVSWNVNGLRACVQKGFVDSFAALSADIFAIQETKLQEGQISLNFDGCSMYYNSAVKKGYSGTAVITKQTPKNVYCDFSAQSALGIKSAEQEYDFESEGRIITCEYDKFYFVNVYTPNSQRELARLEYRCAWEERFREFLSALDRVKPVIVCGDMNVAHEEIDIKNPKTNHKNAGFTDDEREKMTRLLGAGFTDSFRYLYPDKTDAYTWWSYMANARERNIGWRIDYFLVSDSIKTKITESKIFPEVLGSDHCPVMLEIDI